MITTADLAYLCNQMAGVCLKLGFATLLKGNTAERDTYCRAAEVWFKWEAALRGQPLDERAANG